MPITSVNLGGELPVEVEGVLDAEVQASIIFVGPPPLMITPNR
jgi:hypothetical protein